MITMKDIALKANISQTTVSRVFNSNTYVNEETKQLVLKIADELGYKGNINTKKKKKTSLISVILPNISNPFYADILTSVELESSNANYNVIFMNSNDDLFLEQKCVKKSIKMNVDGIIIVANDENHEYLAKIKDQIKIVSITKILKGIDSIAVSHKVGGKLIAKHLISLGHEKIGFIGHKGYKYEGFSKEANKNNIYLDESRYTEYHINFTPKEIKEHIQDFFKKHMNNKNQLDITAIFATHDLLALEVMNKLKEIGYKIPQDIAVVGFDNTFFSKSLGITTVSQPIPEMVHIGFELLMNKINNETNLGEIEKIFLRPRIIPRNTTVFTDKTL